MRYPNLQHENQLLAQGYKLIAGIDEAGRGAWAGPILAGAVILNPKKNIRGLRDSKLLTASARQKLFGEIVKKAMAWAVGIASHDEIDEIGISRANVLAMERALEELNPAPDYLLIDAVKINWRRRPSLSIIDGDCQIVSVAAASIVAKVVRDKIMLEFDRQYPLYGFGRHKGYGTAGHSAILAKHGFCAIHRLSYRPIRDLLNQ